MTDEPKQNGRGARLTVCPAKPDDTVGAKQYIRRPTQVTAFQWDGETCLPGWIVNPNDETVHVQLEACEGTTEIPPHSALLAASGVWGSADIHKGDWIVIGRFGEVIAYDDDTFKRLYAELPEHDGDAEEATQD